MKFSFKTLCRFDRRTESSMTHSSESHILYEQPAPGVARLVLNRPHQANAQDTKLLYDLNDAFDRAAHADDISVIILAANGKHFSAGHDLSETEFQTNITKFRTVGTGCGFACAGAEGQMAREEELYLGFSERWRNIPKPTIAAVQGKCIAAGLMLAWPCDIIIASDDATFADPTVSFGISGHEYFTHVWELGARKAKELLFTSDLFTAQEAHRLGMVNHVVPRDQLDATVLELARRIASKPRFALKLAKAAVNGALDAQGRLVAMKNAFHLHQLTHAHNLKMFDMLLDPTGLPEGTRKAMKIK
jgi:enoyl-CoA hydratase